jgi:hypothetical protein
MVKIFCAAGTGAISPALLDGSVDLADIARMNDWIDVKADNDMRIERWERETVNAEIMKSFLISRVRY